MKQPTLLEVPPDRPSQTARLHAFMAQHGIETHRSDLTREEEPWLAWLRGQDKRTMFDAFAESCRILEEQGLTATGTGELSAVRELCRINNIPFEI